MKFFAILTLCLWSLWFTGCGALSQAINHEQTANDFMAKGGQEQAELYAACVDAALLAHDPDKLDKIGEVCGVAFDAFDRFEADWSALAMAIQSGTANEDKIVALEHKVHDDLVALAAAVEHAIAELKTL